MERLTILVTTVLAIAVGLHATEARSADIVGSTSATLQWQPASGEVDHYGIFVARNGQPFPELPEQTVTTEQATVSAQYGESISIRVAAFDLAGSPGPYSDASEQINFLAPPERDA